MYDIIFLSVPYGNIAVPPLGISVLNGVVKHSGYKSKCIDLSMELYKVCSELNLDFETVQSSLINPEKDLDPVFKEFVDYTVENLIKLKPKFIGISVFSFFAHFSSYYICKEIKKRSNIDIVVGGPGAGTITMNELTFALELTSLEKTMKFGDFLKKRKLADYVIFGDGEQAILDLLSDNNKSFDNYQIFDYKNQFPFANFDDYNFADYRGQLNKGYPQIPVFTSKGCVRNCDFCDVNVVQQKFRFRQGENIVKELIYLADRYGIRDFNFADSLINGSLKSLKEWVTELAAYNKQNPDKRITWSGSWICRPIGQMPEYMYALLAESGCQSVTIGAESGSNQVLASMDKKTTVEALFYEAEQFRKHNIKFMTLLVIGHWSETWTDFLDTLEMLYKLADYVKTDNYIAAGIGPTLSIGKDTPLTENTKNKLQYISGIIWWTELNSELTLKERYYRLLIVEKFCKYYNIPIQDRVLPFVYKTFKQEFPLVNQFYKEKLHGIKTLSQRAEYYFNNFDQLIDLIEDRQIQNNFCVELELESSAVNGAPGIEVRYNNELIFNKLLPEGKNIVKFDLVQNEKNSFKIKLTNKDKNDTIVNEAGNIVKDKYVVIKKFCINGLDLAQDINFYRDYIKYSENNSSIIPRLGFWINESELDLSFDGNFYPWYHKNSKKNNILDVDIVSEYTTVTEYDDNYFRDEIVKLLEQLEV